MSSVLGVIGNPPPLLSEKGMLNSIESQLHEALMALQPLHGYRLDEKRGIEVARRELTAALEKVQRLRAQLRRGVHVNPRGHGPHILSQHVQAIVYRHVQDGGFYVHGFGDATLALSMKRSGALTIGGLKDRTEVHMYGNADGSVSIVGRNGQRLWEEFR